MTVTFSEEHNVCIVDKVRSADRARMWWQDGDYKKFKDNNIETVRLVLGGEDIGASETHCFRGLEGWPNQEKSCRTDRREESFLVVLSAQRDLTKEGFLDGFASAEAYRQETMDSRAEAYKMGLEDEESQILEELESQVRPRRTSTKSSRHHKSRRVAAKVRSSFSSFSRKIMVAAA